MLRERDAVIHDLRNKISYLESEINSERNNNELQKLKEYVVELEEKLNHEKDDTIKLGNMLSEKDDLINEMSMHIKEKNAHLESLKNKSKTMIPKSEVEKLENQIFELNQEKHEFQRQTEKLEKDFGLLKELHSTMESNQNNLQSELAQKELESGQKISDLERILHLKEDELCKINQHLERASGIHNEEIDRVRRNAEAEANRFQKAKMDFEEEIEQLRNEVNQLDKIIQDKDQVISDLRNYGRREGSAFGCNN
jgi:chromosome segregation ATPase